MFGRGDSLDAVPGSATHVDTLGAPIVTNKMVPYSYIRYSIRHLKCTKKRLLIAIWASAFDLPGYRVEFSGEFVL